MSAAGGAGGKSKGEVVPTVYANVDGRTGYKKAATCSASMVDGDLLEALADSRVFKARFENVDLSLSRVYVMGNTMPAEGAPLVNLLGGDATPVSFVGGDKVFLYVDTTEARLPPAVGAPAAAPAAAGVGGGSHGGAAAGYGGAGYGGSHGGAAAGYGGAGYGGSHGGAAAGYGGALASSAAAGSGTGTALLRMLIRIGATVRLAHYFDCSSHEVPVLDTFELFITAARFKFGLPGDARLFWFTSSALKRDVRIALSSQAEYLQFLSALAEGKASLYIHPNSAATSPHTDPMVVPPSTPPRAAAADGASIASERSSAMQRAMVAYVRSRDENAGLPRQCVACGTSPTLLEVARVVSRKTEMHVALAAGLGGLFTAQNGLQMCSDCHFWYDQHLWWVEPLDDGRLIIVVADAVLADESTLPDSKKHFTALHGKELRLPPSARGPLWPTAPMWEIQRQLCAAAREARHAAHDEASRACERCNKPYKTMRGLSAHQRVCAASRRQRQRYLLTPADRAVLRTIRALFNLEPTAEEHDGAERDSDAEDDDEDVDDASRQLFSLETADAGTPGKP